MPNAERDKIFLVVDDQDLNVLIKEVIKPLGIGEDQVVVFSTLGDIDQLFTTSPKIPPQLIVWDLDSGPKNGLTIIQGLKDESSPFKTIPIIVLTVDTRLEEQFREFDVSIMIKPFSSIKKFQEVIQNVLRLGAD